MRFYKNVYYSSFSGYDNVVFSVDEIIKLGNE